VLEYAEITFVIALTVPGHTRYNGEIVLGKVGGWRVFYLSGRSHASEGLHTYEIELWAAPRVGRMPPSDSHRSRRRFFNFLYRSYTTPIGDLSHLIQTVSHAAGLHTRTSPLIGV
jgi:hypothetical protein